MARNWVQGLHCKFELAVSVVFMSRLPVLFLLSIQTIQQLINNEREREHVWLGLENGSTRTVLYQFRSSG